MKVLSLFQITTIHLTDMRCVRAVGAEVLVLGQFTTFTDAENATGEFEGAAGSTGNAMLNVDAL
jgi:hypothetical protein